MGFTQDDWPGTKKMSGTRGLVGAQEQRDTTGKVALKPQLNPDVTNKTTTATQLKNA